MAKKQTKKKYYEGQIPFNCFGDQLHYPEFDRLDYVSTKNWDGKNIWKEVYNYPENKRIILDYFSHQELGFKLFDKPETHHYFGECVGTINSIVWKDNFIFQDTLIYSTYLRGRSAAYFEFISTTKNTNYTVFLKDFEEGFVMQMDKGEISGSFTFCKRGQNYGLVKI